MIENIVNSLGAGAGIDTLELVNTLVEVESGPKTQRLDDKEELLNAQLSDYGILRSALSDLETSLDALSDADAFDAKAVNFPETNILTPTAIDAEAIAGDYQIQVTAVARAQSLNSTTFATSVDEVGKGTLTFRFGKWDDGAADDDAVTNFTVDAEKTGATITIDDTNNSLTGLRDAINDADFGVQASIINDGSDFRLLITAPSGDNNEIEIVVEEDGVATNNDGNDLSRFAFNTGGSQLTQAQGGDDAALTINGLAVTRESNVVDDVIAGLDFTIQNSSLTETVNLTITEDKATAQQSVRDFVEAYNGFIETVAELTEFNDETDEFGSLKTDPLAGNMVSRLRGLIGASVPGISTGYTALTNVGVRTNRDGSIEIDEDDFATAFDDNFDLVKTLFTPRTSSDSSLIRVTGFNAQTEPGTYAVNITNQSSSSILNGADLAGPPVSFDSTLKDYSFEITVDGVASGTISVTDATVFTPEQMATELQSQINLDSLLADAGASVTVTWDTDNFVITSDSLGSNSTLSVTVLGGDIGELGITIDTGTPGEDVDGTVDNVSGFGLGNVFLPALNTDPTGLSMLVSPGATTANITYSRGFAEEMARVIDDFLKSAGLISTRETTIRERLSDIDDDRDLLELRTEAYRARLTSQFIAMDQIVQSLRTSGSFFDDIAKRLPFTSGA